MSAISDMWEKNETLRYCKVDSKKMKKNEDAGGKNFAATSVTDRREWDTAEKSPIDQPTAWVPSTQSVNLANSR